MIYYCDSSAVTKIYIEEVGTSFMRKIRRNVPNDGIFVNEITGPEVLAALHRRFRSGDLTLEQFSKARKDFRNDFLNFFEGISVSGQIISLAMQLIEKYPLKGYDSVQLAIAVHFQKILRTFDGEEVHFVSSDKVLNSAAQSEGLVVIDPSEQA